MKIFHAITSIFILNILFISVLSAEEKIELESMSIIGNKELPKMLYIVPWKNSELPQANVPPIESLVDEALAPVDRDAFKRAIRYYQIYSVKEN